MTSPTPNALSEHARILPRLRPEGAPAARQRWRDLLFVHWKVDPGRLRQLVPPQLDLDLFEGHALVGAVPFEMRDVAPSWLPRFLAFNFLETNLRTYVSFNGEPGVYFFSLEASSWLAVHAARIGWHLPYHHARMGAGAGDVRTYTSRRRRGGATFNARYSVGDAMGHAEPGSAEFFLLERYLLFSMRRQHVLRGQVHHEPYPIQRVTLHEWEESLFSAAGFAPPSSAPAFVHFSPGVDVEVFGPLPAG